MKYLWILLIFIGCTKEAPVTSYGDWNLDSFESIEEYPLYSQEFNTIKTFDDVRFVFEEFSLITYKDSMPVQLHIIGYQFGQKVEFTAVHKEFNISIDGEIWDIIELTPYSMVLENFEQYGIVGHQTRTLYLTK